MDTSALKNLTTCDGFTKKWTIGKGTFGKVYLMEKNGQQFAMKVINQFDNEEAKREVLKSVYQEYQLLQAMQE